MHYLIKRIFKQIYSDKNRDIQLKIVSQNIYGTKTNMGKRLYLQLNSMSNSINNAKIFTNLYFCMKI